MARHSSFLRIASSVLGCALLVSRGEAADPPAPQRGVILLSDEGGWGRPSGSVVPYRRVLEGARRSLTACHEIALAEDPGTAAQVDAQVRVGPNGEVMSVSMTARGAVADVALACFRRQLVNLIFDPPGGGGATLNVALIMGDPPAATRPPLPIRVESQQTVFAIGPIPMRLRASPPQPAFRAVRAATRTLESCAAANPPAGAVVVDVRLLISDKGDISRLSATSISADAERIVLCVTKAEARAPGATENPNQEHRGRLAHVDLRMSVATDGKVSLAP